MSEKLTAEQKYKEFQKSLSPYVIRKLQLSKTGIIILMEEYAAQQVQQITEERDKALDLLKRANSILNRSYKIEPWSPFAQEVQDFLNSINKTNG